MSELFDLDSERRLLATAIEFPQAADAVAAVPVEAFYVPQNRVIAEVIHRLVADGATTGDVPSDASIVMHQAMQLAGGGARSELVRNALMDMVGQGVPASVSFHVERLLTLYRARKMVETGTRLRQAAEESPDQLDVVISEALAEIEAQDQVSTTGLDPERFSQLRQVDTNYDWLVPELLECTDRLVITGFEGTGKALAIDTSIPTPDGWTTMGKLTVGDQVFTPSGEPVQIIAATEVMEDRPCYRVCFSDGSEIIADENHLWETETLAARESAARQRRRGETKKRGTDQRHRIVHTAAVVTTGQIRDTLHARGGHSLNHSIRVTEPLAFPERDLPIHPYVLGAWLGDGTSRSAALTCADQPIIDEIRACGEVIRKADERYLWRFGDGNRRISREAKAQTLNARLRILGVLGDKHVPEPYLTASIEQRVALLQGLMDTDGTVDRRGLCEFSVCNERLARGFFELVCTLGIKATIRESSATLDGREVGRRWRIGFKTNLPVFRLPRKAQRLGHLPTHRSKLRYITAVEPVDSVPVRCIQVANPDGMFVAGRACIPTHNSVLLAQFAACLAAGIHPFLFVPLDRPKSVLVVDAENSRRQVTRRYGDLIERIEGKRRDEGFAPPAWDETLGFLLRPEGLFLNEPTHLRTLENMIVTQRPDVVVAGPLYRLHSSDTKDEQAAKELINTIDRLRVKYHFAFICEAHVNHGTPGQNRALRPTGSSVFLRWPEFGVGLKPGVETDGQEHPDQVNVVHWRGGRDERIWPRKLQHTVAMPWGVADERYFNEHQHRGLI